MNDRGRQRGFSYIEALIATLLIALALVPALDALHSGIQGSAVHAARADIHFRLVEKMEELLAKPFDELEQEADAAADMTTVVTTYSDSAGSPARRLVYLARYDGDNADNDDDPFSGADDDLLWVRVEIENSNDALQTLKAR